VNVPAMHYHNGMARLSFALLTIYLDGAIFETLADRLNLSVEPVAERKEGGTVCVLRLQ
jgi:hypothetical protein